MAIIDDDIVISATSIAVGTSTIQLDTSAAPERLVKLILQADDGNSGDIYLGGSDVSADNSLTLDARESLVLAPTEFFGTFVHHYNLGGFYARASASAQRLKIIKFTRQRDL